MSCHSFIFSKKQTDFATNMSSMLGGARVNLTVTTTRSTSEGSFNNFEIEIEGLADSLQTETNLLLASSIPAYVFYKDTIADRKSYKYIDVVVKMKGKEYTSRYTPAQLQQVDDCGNTVTGYLGALKTMNIDSLRYYSDTSMTGDSVLSSLADKLKAADEKWGAVQSEDAKGFRLDEKDGKTYIYFKMYLKRQVTTQGANFWIDPATKKVISYSL